MRAQKSNASLRMQQSRRTSATSSVAAGASGPGSTLDHESGAHFASTVALTPTALRHIFRSLAENETVLSREKLFAGLRILGLLTRDEDRDKFDALLAAIDTDESGDVTGAYPRV